MGGGTEMLDILVLLALAAFFISRLRKVLGKEIDDSSKPDNRKSRGDKSDEGRVVNLREAMRASPTSAAAVDAAVHQVEDDAPLLADIDDPDVSKGLTDIKNADAGFNVREFITGAQMAFEMIVDAYQKGDKDSLRDLLSREIFKDFEAAIDERKHTDTYQESTLVAVDSANISRARLNGRTAEVTVTFVSEQITVERDKDGTIVAGDPSATELVTDEWTFSRDTRSQNPNWTLTGT